MVLNFPTINAAGRRKLARRERDARRGQLGRGRYDALAKRLAMVIRVAFETGATGSLFGLEGPLRHSIRADLCLQGWGWSGADLMARDLLDDAFRRVNAQRPDWDEGQPEWTIHAGTLIERTRCVRCHAPLPEGHFKYCGSNCRVGHWMWMSRRKEAAGDTAVMMAIRSI
ncbi:hypothetical protein [Paracoccus sp. (in: a-proteobacteria)]|uniref:hypothetical protein n=1 Tax=Paracoccus sp. TaxID=267 RepID=UPI0028AE1102|nr:hypothetical protein [Paracoccus sp. (in: a-proteobacteria)]